MGREGDNLVRAYVTRKLDLLERFHQVTDRARPPRVYRDRRVRIARTQSRPMLIDLLRNLHHQRLGRRLSVADCAGAIFALRKSVLRALQ